MTGLALGAPAADAVGWARGWLRRRPVTLGTLIVVLAGGLVAGLLSGASPIAPAPQLLDRVAVGVGRPMWRLVTAPLWCAGPGSYLLAVLATVLVLVPAERRLGARVTLVILVAGQLLGCAVGLAVIGLFAATGDPWGRHLVGMEVVGPFPGLLAVAGLTSARCSVLWRRRLRLSLTVMLSALVLYSGTTADVLRLTGWLLGLTAGALLHRRHDRAVAALPASRREARTQVALVVAVTALGPLLAAVVHGPGPWAVVSHLFVAGRPGAGVLRAVCGPAGDAEACRLLQMRHRLTGYGPSVLSMLPVLVQLLLAEGLRRGRRAAWLAAVVFTAALTVVGAAVSIAVLRTPAEALPLLDARPGSLPAVSQLAPLLAPLGVLVLLLLTRHRFGIRAGSGTIRRWLLAAGAGLAIVAVGYVAVGSLLRAQFVRTPSAVALLADLPTRMLPPGYLGEVLPPLVPLHGPARMLSDWAGVAAWTVLLTITVRLVRPSAPTDDAARARALVDRWGDGSLSFMATWVGNRYWLAPDGAALVAYRIIRGVAVTTGDPIGPSWGRAEATREFTVWCEEHGWTPCWYSVTDDVAAALAGTGARSLQVASETWLRLGGQLTLTGRRWQDVRTALNRARREGIEAHWMRWSTAPLAIREQVTRLCEDWLAGKGLPEMEFTLGGIDELGDDAVRVLLATDPSGKMLGLTSWLPAHRDRQLVGWTLDMMRRAPDAVPGTVEALIATAALTFQNEGAQWVSLSGAPLALPPHAADHDRLTRLLTLTGRLMEPVYGFGSLLAFKAKFQPEHRPLWIVYPDTGDLPRIAAAISRAYLPHMSAREAGRLATAVVRGHRATQYVPKNVPVS